MLADASRPRECDARGAGDRRAPRREGTAGNQPIGGRSGGSVRAARTSSARGIGGVVATDRVTQAVAGHAPVAWPRAQAQLAGQPSRGDCAVFFAGAAWWPQSSPAPAAAAPALATRACSGIAAAA